MLTTKDVRRMAKAPWWDLVKNEVARAISIRIKADDLEIKPHGSILGQMFVDTLNDHPECRAYVHYLTTRPWTEVLSDVEGELSREVLGVLRHEEGARWFLEFQKFLKVAWKNSVDPAPPAKDGPPTFRAVIETDFFRDFLRIWAGHLKMGRPPHLLANMLAGLMLDDPDFEMLYNWLAAAPYKAVLVDLQPKLDEGARTLFWSPEAETFFDGVIGIIAARIKADYEQRGIVMPDGGTRKP